MTTIATIGPKGSHAWQAAYQYRPNAEIKLYPSANAVFTVFEQGGSDYAMVPAYNTREGENREYLRLMSRIRRNCWIDNIVLPVYLSLASLDDHSILTMLVGQRHDLQQCEEYITAHFPDASLMVVQDISQAILKIKNNNIVSSGIIGAEQILKNASLHIRVKETASYNRTRFAVLGQKISSPTGYDATAVITIPLKDRVGILSDILCEFTRRGINLLDMRSETDVKTQKLQFYIEFEGHSQDQLIRQAINQIEHKVIHESGSIKILGSYPRVDMRVKHIKKIGFIGSGDMSRWFADRLDNEGYETFITGRSTILRPEEMIPAVNVVVICVPISVTAATIKQYGLLLRDNQALIILAGAAENILDLALAATAPEVEVMLIHNLWGPQAISMKDKNVVIVRSTRSGGLCSEFEAFLYKHGACICQDTPRYHDLMMGVSQKLPTAISVALAMTIKDNSIKPEDISSHSTLTSLYSVLSMVRVHAQNPRTYAEIMGSQGEGRRIVRDFVKNLLLVLDMIDQNNINGLCQTITSNSDYLSDEFLAKRMRQALIVDQALDQILRS